MANRIGAVALLLGLAGCFTSPAGTALVATTIGDQPIAARFAQHAQTAPATEEAGRLVAQVGQKVVGANPALGLRPRFLTVGGDAPPELFHRGDSEVVITESLARQCKTEGQLAALLSLEMGKMVSERSSAGLVQLADRGPPMAVQAGADAGGIFGPPDGTRLMELAKYERKRALARESAEPPAPDTLARAYLQTAGYNPADLEAVVPLLRKAEENSRLEKTMTR